MSLHITTWSTWTVGQYIHQASRELTDRGDRLDLLRQLSTVLLPATDFDYDAERRKNPWTFMAPPSACWACHASNQRLYWHHVVWCEHNGPTEPWNLVSICYACHREIHPDYLEPHLLDVELYERQHTAGDSRTSVVTYEVLPASTAPPNEIGDTQPFAVCDSEVAARAEARELLAQFRHGSGALRYTGRPYGVAIYRCDGVSDACIEVLRA